MKEKVDIAVDANVEVRLQFPGQTRDVATVLSTMPLETRWLLLKTQPPGSKIVLVTEVELSEKWRDANFAKGRWLYASTLAMDEIPVRYSYIILLCG